MQPLRMARNYSISWSHGPTTEDVAGLAPGTYIITVTDNVSGCIGISSFVVGEDTEITASVAITTLLVDFLMVLSTLQLQALQALIRLLVNISNN